MPVDVPGDYPAWRAITYDPAIPALYPERLLPRVPPPAKVIDFGCNRGHVAIWLAERGYEVTGLDINPGAITEARASAARRGLTASFFAQDSLEFDAEKQFDAALLIRVLTCFPEVESWRRMREHALAALKPGGTLYIHDFMYVPESTVYGPRYLAGERRGWRRGNFEVTGPAGEHLFIAHHHDEEEVTSLAEGLEEVTIEKGWSISMNGNPCRMFELLGTAVGSPAGVSSVPSGDPG